MKEGRKVHSVEADTLREHIVETQGQGFAVVSEDSSEVVKYGLLRNEHVHYVRFAVTVLRELHEPFHQPVQVGFIKMLNECKEIDLPFH